MLEMFDVKIIGALAVATTICQFLAGSLVCKKYIRSKSTGESSCVPFTCGYISCSLWLFYGLLKGDNNIILVNSIGMCSQLIYVLIFYIITYQKRFVIYQFLSASFIQAFILYYMSQEDVSSTKLEVMGFISSVFTLIFIAAPLTKLFYVIRVRSTESLPYPVIVSSFFVSFLWCLYGSLLEDKYLIVTNLLGCILASLQLCLFVVIPYSATSDISKLMRDNKI